MIKTANLTGSVSRLAGGLFESVRRLVQSLVNGGLDVQVFSLMDRFTAQDLPHWSPVPVKTLCPRWPKPFGYAAGMLTELRRFAPDISHTHGLWMYPSAVTNYYHRRTGAPYIISPHGMLDPWAVRHSRWRKQIVGLLCENSHLRRAHCLRALCESEARAIRSFGLRNPIAIIPNGMDLPGTGDGAGPQPLLAKSEAEPFVSAVRSERSGRKVLLYLGRLHPKKGLGNLLQAWANLRQTGGWLRQDWILTIAGWDQGGYERELKTLANQLGLAWTDVRDQRRQFPNPTISEHPRAHIGRTCHGQTLHPENSASLLFLGPVFGQEKAACYASCDAFILPSLSEGLPMAVLEAWAFGKPVLMTPECNLPEGFATDSAIPVSPDPAGIKKGLEQLLNHSSFALRLMGENGRQLVRQKFAWPTVAAQTKSVYEWMLGGGAKPDCLADF